MNLQALLNKRVVAEDGARLGKIYDFRARQDGNDLLITHIAVGAGAWIERLHLPPGLRRLIRAAEQFDIPWEAIGAVGDDVRLDRGWNRARCDQCRVASP